jgi:Cu+-exporting ATPase
MAIDPVCGMEVDPATAAAVRRHEDRNYFFCNVGCAEAFEADPGRFLAPGAAPTGAHHRTADGDGMT